MNALYRQAFRLLVLSAVALPAGRAIQAETPVKFLVYRKPVSASSLPATVLTGAYAQRYGLYNYHRNWYAMPYRYRSMYYRPWYTLPPSYFVVPKNYSPYIPPTWSLPWPYGDYPSLPPLPLGEWPEAPSPEFLEPGGPPIEVLPPPRAGGRYYW